MPSKQVHSINGRTAATPRLRLVLAGELDLMLDEETTHLSAGNIAVMQATSHAWINHGSEPCRIAFILVDAKDPL
jgi:uncharacterized cupin superfamily protein